MNTRLMSGAVLFTLIFCGSSSAAEAEIPVDDPPCCKCQGVDRQERFSKKESLYRIPDVSLVRMDGTRVSAHDEVDHDGPILLQFAFTSCSTICPVLSATTAQLQKKLGDDATGIRMVTISIDPQHDTTAVLKQYARSLEAGEQWHFLTGDAKDIAEMQKAFDAYTPNKSRHEALTFLRSGRNTPWVRVTGLISAAALTKEVRVILDNAEKR
jgi:protein SCO1/2